MHQLFWSWFGSGLGKSNFQKNSVKYPNEPKLHKAEKKMNFTKILSLKFFWPILMRFTLFFKKNQIHVDFITAIIFKMQNIWKDTLTFWTLLPANTHSPDWSKQFSVNDNWSCSENSGRVSHTNLNWHQPELEDWWRPESEEILFHFPTPA